LQNYNWNCNSVEYMGIRRNFSRGDNVGILLILFRLLTIQWRWRFTKRFTLSTRQRKFHMLRQESQKLHFVGSSLFFFHASFDTVWKLHAFALSAVTVSLYLLPYMSANNSHMHQNVCYRNLKWTFEYLLPCYRCAMKTNIRTIRLQVSQPASAGKWADMSELQAHHCITPDSERGSCGELHAHR